MKPHANAAVSPATADIALPAALATAPGVQCLEQAAQWYATLRDGNATDQHRQAWQAWLARSPEHAAAWQHIENVSRRFEPLRGGGARGRAAAVAGAEAARATALGRRRALNGLAGVLAAGAAAWLGWRHTALPELMVALRADHRTGTGERRDLVLADGTRVWLNTATAVQVDYKAEQRRVVLLYGEVLVDTVPDRRPFFVETGFGRMQALGTRFTVRHSEARTRLDVFEGAVEVHTPRGTARRVDAGHAARFDADGIGPLEEADRMREAWSRGRIPADNLPLGELLAELARYRRGRISVAPAVAGIRVMGVYPTDDTDRALAMLERNLPIRVHRSLPWWVTVEGR
ncbi:MAG: FecR domain-containing protein [Pseudomonadota bacterium]